MSHPLLYEINTRCWLRELSGDLGRVVTLGSVPDEEFEHWLRLGCTHIWLMGVWAGGPLAHARATSEPGQRRHYTEVLPDLQQADIGPSPYAIAKYEVAAELGGDLGLAAFRKALNGRGLKLVLDFVPNHLGLDHEWVRSRPDLFVQSERALPGCYNPDPSRPTLWLAHGKDPNFWPWTDTVQVDYRREDAREAMRHLLLKVAERCDGVRCDMAMLLLNEVFWRTWNQFPCGFKEAEGEFWENAIGEVKRRFPEFMFLAEVYWKLESKLQDLGFDYTYDKELYDRLAARDGAGVQRHLLNMNPAGLAAGAHFLENHDEQRAAAVWTVAEHYAAAVLVLSLPGMRFLHEGQLAGARVRVPVQLLRRPREPVEPEIAHFYEDLFRVLPQTAIGRGRFRLLRPEPLQSNDTAHERVILIQWQDKNSGFDLVAINLSSSPARIQVPVQPDRMDNIYEVADLLTSSEPKREPAVSFPHLELHLPPQGARILHFREIAG